MYTYYPLLVIGAVLGVLSTVFIIAYATMKDKKNAIGFDRHMKDSEILRRLLHYAKPYKWRFLLVGLLVIISIVYDILSPLLIGGAEELVKGDFEMKALLSMVAAYAGILVVS
ncbi:MAG: ABC transporter ATP-binding protein, partial [Clostridia bacterium]|nr:ABC transporter ATP-binding protein [Clostridia bacterium]